MRGHPLYLATVLGLFLALTGCAGDSTGGTPNPSPSGSVRLQIYKLGASANTAKGSVTVHAYESSVQPTGTIKPREGNRFVAIDVEGCAGPKADDATGIDPVFFYLQFKAEPIYPVNESLREPGLHKTALAPGRCARGWVSFEIPEAAKPQYAFFRSSTRIAWILPQ